MDPSALLGLTQPSFRLPRAPHSHRSPGYLSDFAGVLVTATLQLGFSPGPSLTPLIDSFPHGVYSQVSVSLLVAMLSQHSPLRSGHPDLPCLKLLRNYPSQIRVGWSSATSCPTRSIAHGWK